MNTFNKATIVQMMYNTIDRLLSPYMFAAPTEPQYIALAELLARAGIKKRQLDYYIREGAVSPPVGRTSSARYTVKHLEQILRVKDLLKRRHTVKEIAEACAEHAPELRSAKTLPNAGRRGTEKLIVHHLTEGIRIVVNEELLPTEVTLLNELLKLAKLSIERRSKLLADALTRDKKVHNQENATRRRKKAPGR